VYPDDNARPYDHLIIKNKRKNLMQGKIYRGKNKAAWQI
jgi:hypothetical protein